MQKNILIALGAVVVVAIVVAAGLFVMTGDKKDDKLPEFQKDTGTVYGNADGNYCIDSTDRTVIKKIIDGDASLEDYPFADANNDGVVNDKDLEIVDNYLDGKSCTLKVLDSENKIINVAYPISNIIVLCGSNLAPLMNILDVNDKIVGAAYTSNKFDSVRDYPVDQGVKNGTIKKITTDGTAADFEIISDLKDNKDCHFMMTELSSMYPLDSDDNVTILNGMGIDVVRMESRDPGQDMRSLAVFGILLNKSENVKQYQDFVTGVYEEIAEKIGDKAGTRKVLIASLTSSLSGQSSGYTTMIEMAKGVNVIDSDDNVKTKAGDTWFLDPKYNVDLLFLGVSCGYSDSGFKESSITSYKNIYQDHNAWKNGEVYVYSTSIPVVARVAYYAESMYPDCFDDGYGKSIHQSFVDKFFQTPHTVDDARCIILVNGS